MGEIIIHKQRNKLGRVERVDFSWEGDPYTEIYHLSYRLWPYIEVNEKKNEISVGPFQLKIVDRNWGGYQKCVRMDYPVWWILYFWHKINRIAEIIYRHTIITLTVWGMAEYIAGTIPSWEDIYLLRKLFKKEK